MEIMQVFLKVKPENIEAFKAACLANAQSTRQEPGNIRFEVFQQADDPTQFSLLEIYESSQAVAAHFQSQHFAQWRDATGKMIIEGRSYKFTPLTPPEDSA